MNAYPIPNGYSVGNITPGSDDAMWFQADATGVHVDRIDMSGQFTQYTGPAGNPDAGGFTHWALGPDGNLWSLVCSSNLANGWIERLTPQGQFTVFNPDVYMAGPWAWGSDGNLWFLGGSSSQGVDLWQMTPTGTCTLMGILQNPSEIGVGGMVVGPDGNLWIGQWGSAASGIARINPDLSVSFFPTPSFINLQIGVANYAVTADGFWFIHKQQGPNLPDQIMHMTLDGTVTEYTLPNEDDLLTIAVGPDGDLWCQGDVSPTQPAIFQVTHQGA
jgi:streptogramin lyase